MSENKEQVHVKGELEQIIKDHAAFGQAILKSIQNLGIGVLSKTDFEAFMFHQLTLLCDDSIKDNYDWMRILKATPAKIRSLQMIQSAKYKDLDTSKKENWSYFIKSITKKNIEIEDINKGTIRFYIDDVHAQRLIERFIVEQGSSIDYSLNKNQMILKFDMFSMLTLHIAKLNNINETDFITKISNDKSIEKLKLEFNSLSSFFKNLKEKAKNEATYDLVKEFFSGGLNIFFNYLSNKLSSK
jgi:hypothetical protein